jgi:TfoX/Sxy family transcriptional regulator of competence genes
VKYYSEEDMGDLRKIFEAEVMEWRKVSLKEMFGCPCYTADGKLFAFLVTRGLVITKLNRAEKKAVSHLYQTTFFKAGNKTVRSWMRVPIRSGEDLDRVMRYVRKSYEAALRVM